MYGTIHLCGPHFSFHICHFLQVIIYSDPERAYQELLREINLLEREPQWVPASWVQNKKASFYK